MHISYFLVHNTKYFERKLVKKRGVVLYTSTRFQTFLLGLKTISYLKQQYCKYNQQKGVEIFIFQRAHVATECDTVKV